MRSLADILAAHPGQSQDILRSEWMVRYNPSRHYAISHRWTYSQDHGRIIDGDEMRAIFDAYLEEKRIRDEQYLAAHPETYRGGGKEGT